MKFRHYVMAAAMLAAFGTTFVSCSEETDGTENPSGQGGNDQGGDNQGGNAYDLTVEGNVEGTWTKGSRIHVTGHITVPEGKSLNIEEGVELVFATEGVGVNHVPVEFIVKGNLYCNGTAENPILMSVPENQRLATPRGVEQVGREKYHLVAPGDTVLVYDLPKNRDARP